MSQVCGRALLVLFSLSAACSDARPAREDARERWDAIQHGFAAVLRAPPPTRLGDSAAARVELPADGAGQVTVTESNGMSVAFSMVGARAVAQQRFEQVTFYAGAAPQGADVFHRTGPLGDEDFVLFPVEPALKSLSYAVDVGRVAGLRLVGNTLEFLDARGTPRLRVAPPVAWDAEGHTISPTLQVAGCMVDTNARAPWGRPVTPPGASHCTMVVSWQSSGVHYPMLLDPQWVSTGHMVVPRYGHAVSDLGNTAAPPSDVRVLLVTGGVGPSGNVLNSAELYEPLSRTFSPTASMWKARALHTSTSLSVDSGGRVLVAGGAGAVTDPVLPQRFAIVSLGDSSSTETYSAQTGTFSLGPPMAAPRFGHTATELTDGRVLLAGGTTDLVNQPTRSAELFSWDPVLVSGSSTPTGNMGWARQSHASTRLPNGDVLVSGGLGSASFSLLSAEVFNAATGDFTPVASPMTAPRAMHTSTLLASGEVLLAGGLNGVSPPITFMASADVYSQGAFSSVVTLQQPRALHSAVALQPGVQVGGATPAQALLIGGFDGTTILSSVEAYAGGATTLGLQESLVTGVVRAVAMQVNAGGSTTAGRGVLVAGGLNATATSQAQILFKTLGEACIENGECGSGHCAQGVCCNNECIWDCYSCLAAQKQDQGANGTCGPVTSGTAQPAQCIQGTEFHTACNATGHLVNTPDTHDCRPWVCGSTGLCASSCDGSPGSCATGAFCSLPGDGGPVGLCAFQQPASATCLSGEQCTSGLCVDGVCCNSACNGACEACDVPGAVGACTPLPGGCVDAGAGSSSSTGATGSSSTTHPSSQPGSSTEASSSAGTSSAAPPSSAASGIHSSSRIPSSSADTSQGSSQPAVQSSSQEPASAQGDSSPSGNGCSCEGSSASPSWSALMLWVLGTLRWLWRRNQEAFL